MDLGFTRGMIDHKIETKQWTRVMGRSVLSASTTHPAEAGKAWAAYLACGRGAVLSGPSALRRHGIDAPTGDRVWMTVPPERHVRVDGVRTIRETLPDTDIVEFDGMRVTSLARAVIDTLRVLPERLGQPIVDRALLRGWLTADELARSVEIFAGRRGVLRLRTYEVRARSGARSEAERRLHDILHDAGITGWVADFKILDADGRLLAVLDAAFEADQVAIEVDGLAFHSDPAVYQGDRTRQNWLQVYEGWEVIRFTWDDLTKRRGYVVRTVRAALAKRRRQRR
jgi:very-short-patch-repair endonuclease